ncbi:polycomb group protein EMBRYONIC FLOWER 2 isoform X1 [Nymphaea colorata]|nr:polycomb group protein EMBRYONIC FLOWER 2 isoform X1 [Nymphaea colorata]XP_031483351.1 polycomb group protein EMBRYONIC FLOWER 2 isoform X1 [Nymphaea colorata]
MPGLPLVVRETTNLGCSCSHPRTVEQMCRQDSRVHLSTEEAAAAEESLSVYCKPVELYNILQRRALRHPSFLQRCLHYKIQAKHKKRIQLTISLPAFVPDGVELQSFFPLFVLLAAPVSDITVSEKSVNYRIIRACPITACSEFGRRDQTEASFILPEIRKLSIDAKSGNVAILFVTFGELRNQSADGSISSFAFLSSKFGSLCHWGKLPLDFLSSSWEESASLHMGHRTEVLQMVDLHPSILEHGNSGVENCIKFQTRASLSMKSAMKQMQVNIYAQELGARERSPYDSYSYHDVPASSLSHIVRLRTGNVIFNYRYYNNTLQKTEVTEDFSCPFCLVQCASFKGLRHHLTSCHDLFNFEFWVTEEYQAVNVSVKTDTWRSEVVADGIDPRLQTFFYCSKSGRRRRSKAFGQNGRFVQPQVLKLESPDDGRADTSEDCVDKNACTSSSPMAISTSPIFSAPSRLSSRERSKNDGDFGKVDEGKMVETSSDENHLVLKRHKAENSVLIDDRCTAECIQPAASSPNAAGVCAITAQDSGSAECAMPGSGSNLAPPAMLPFAKTRKLSAERADPRNRALLQKRQFFHSHRAQPMALEQVLSDRDSEDEVDDDIADFEDRRMLDDFVDVTKDEKQIMHLWNSFVRKQRVLADGHIPWACEAFSKLHGRDLVRIPALMWCWRLFMIKLWNHSLLDARTMNNCNLILEKFRDGNSDDQQS